MSLKNFGGNISNIGKGNTSSTKSGLNRTPKKLDSAKSASKKSEVTRRKRRKVARAALEVQAKELLKKY